MTRNDIVGYCSMFGMMTLGFFIMYWSGGFNFHMMFILVPYAIIVIFFTKFVRPIMNGTDGKEMSL